MIKIKDGQTFEGGLGIRNDSGKITDGIFLRADSSGNLFVVAANKGKQLYVFPIVQLLKDLGWTPPKEQA